MSYYRCLTLFISVLFFASCNEKGDRQSEKVGNSITDSLTMENKIKLRSMAANHENESQYAKPDETQMTYENFFNPSEQYYVIYNNGSALYNHPDNQSDILTKLKFRDSVTVLEQPKPLKEITANERNTEPEFWIKVRSKGKEGFIRSSHLSIQLPPPALRPAHLLLSGVTCAVNYTFDSTFHYYGLFETESGIGLREVSPEFYVGRHPTENPGMEWLYISTGGDWDPLFTFGLGRKLNKVSLKRVEILKTGENQGRLLMHNGITLNIKRTLNSSASEHLQLTFTSSSGTVLHKLETSHVLWCGDIDEDNKLDFAYNLGTQESEGIALSLSSMCNGNEVIKEVAVFVTDPCW